MPDIATERRPFLWNVYSQFMSAIGALSLLNIVKDTIQLKQLFRDFLHAWTAVVHPLAQTLFGWIEPAWVWMRIPITLPEWYQDYLIIGIVVTSASIRGVLDVIAVAPRRMRIVRKLQQATDVDEQDAEEYFTSLDSVLRRNGFAPNRSSVDLWHQASARGPNFRWQLIKVVRECLLSTSLFESSAQRALRDPRGVVLEDMIDELRKHDRAEQRTTVLVVLIALFPLWPLGAFFGAVIVRTAATDDKNISIPRYALTTLQFLIYFVAIVLVNYAWTSS